MKMGNVYKSHDSVLGVYRETALSRIKCEKNHFDKRKGINEN